MTDHGDSERAAESYAVAFRVGAIGSIVLVLGVLLGHTLAWLLALTVWSGITLFVLPWLYIWYCDKEPLFPMDLLKGPHQ